MKRSYVAAILISAASSLAAPAFASGYGPAPYYRAEEGAPVSQSGMRSMTASNADTTNAAGKSLSFDDAKKAADDHLTEVNQTARSQP